MELILNELREKTKNDAQAAEQGAAAGIPAEEALHWLTIRICINNDIAKVLNDELSNKRRKMTTVERQARFIEISLLWHCAALRDFTPKKLKEYYGRIRDERFDKTGEGLSRQDFIDLTKDFLYHRFPHISNSSILRILATYFEISGTGIKPNYTWDEVDGFGEQFFPIMMWEAGEKVKTMLKFIQKAGSQGTTESEGTDKGVEQDREAM